MEPEPLRSELLLLDQPGLDDADAMVAALNRPEIERVLTTPWPCRSEHADDFIQSHVPDGWQSGREFTWALRAPGSPALAGVIGLRVERPDLGYWTVPASRGRGLTAEAVRLVADWWFARGGPALAWECVVGNVASLGVARAAGFRFTGTAPSHGPYRDGAHPLSWHGVLEPGPRRRHDGWPA